MRMREYSKQIQLRYNDAASHASLLFARPTARTAARSGITNDEWTPADGQRAKSIFSPLVIEIACINENIVEKFKNSSGDWMIRKTDTP